MQSAFHSFAPIALLFFVCLAVLQPLEIPCHIFVEKVSELIYTRLLVAPLQHLQSHSLVYEISSVDGLLQFQKFYWQNSCKMTSIILVNPNLSRHISFAFTPDTSIALMYRDTYIYVEDLSTKNIVLL